MTFAPQHDYSAYDAAIANQRQSRPAFSVEQKFLRDADFYDTLLKARKQLSGIYDARQVQKRAKIRARDHLLIIYRLLDETKNEE